MMFPFEIRFEIIDSSLNPFQLVYIFYDDILCIHHFLPELFCIILNFRYVSYKTYSIVPSQAP